MNIKYILLVVIVGIVCGVLGYVIATKTGFSDFSKHSSSSQAKQNFSEKKILFYKCPMHPMNTSDRPGKCGICGMDLVPVYAQDSSPEEGIVHIDPAMVQNIGVKTEQAQKRAMSHVIRTVGRVDYNETSQSIISTKISGFVEKLYVDYTGRPVRKGEPLFELYSPELIAAQEEFIRTIQYGNTSASTMMQTNAAQLVETLRSRLLSWDMSSEQIAELEQKRVVHRTFTYRSPVSGLVVEKNVLQGMKINMGANIFKIADLSTVWIYADLYESDLPWVKVGQNATVELSYSPGTVLRGRVSSISPFLQGQTRTAQARIELANPRMLLKPEMYGNVTIETGNAITVLTVPEQSVMRSGTRDIVVLALGDGRFKPVEVRLGALSGGYYQIIEGLHEGQTIVTSSQFLIDSESNLKAGLAGMAHEHTPQNAEEYEGEQSKQHNEQKRENHPPAVHDHGGKP